MRATINFYLTWKCNFTCAHCIHECGPQGNHATLEQIQYGFDFARWLMKRNVQIAVIGTTGGEATLHPLFWSEYMPRLKAFQDEFMFNAFELHTNASTLISVENRIRYPKFFSTIYVGHDMCHRSFASLSELHLQDYTDITGVLNLRQNDYVIVGMHTMLIRNKGRAAESISKGIFEVLNVQGYPKPSCTWHGPEQRGSDCLHFTFTPDHVNHCGEKSHPLPVLSDGQSKVDEGQFHPYGMDFDKLMHAGLDYTTKYSGENCSQKCMSVFCQKPTPRCPSKT